MTASKHVTLWCDHRHPDCLVLLELGEASSVGVARQEARRDGWYSRGSRDYCPAHKAEHGWKFDRIEPR